jgi:glycosyltransferase involved in cell wall biosynthesis
MMKKVLIIYKFLPQYRADFYEQLKARLLEHNIELHLIYGKSNKVDALRKDEIEIDWAKYIPNRRFYLGKTEILWQPCLNHLRDKDLIIVQPENKFILNYYLMLSRRFAKYKFAFWGHVYNMQDDVNSLRNKFKLLFLNKCDWWFGYTKGAKEFLVDKNFPENKITVVQNAIDTLTLKKHYIQIPDSELIKLKEQLGIKKLNTGIYCGGMYPDKKLDFILQACYKIKNEIPDFHMLFIGSGAEANKVVKAAESSDWIHYLGPKFGKDRVIYFKISSVQLMPGVVGLGILDSFAMETPIITTHHSFHSPEIDYLENEVNGIMTKYDIEEYSQSIIGILKTKKYLRLMDGCKVSSEKYTVENMAENFKNGILACLN